MNSKRIDLIADSIRAIVGPDFIRTDDEARRTYGMDALERGALADVVVLPGTTREVAEIVRACGETRTPIVPRGGGTGFTGGAVPVRGGVVLSLERMNRILEIDEASLVAVVQPNVITGDLQDAVERVGLFYPPDPSSLRRSAIGGNVAECAGGPRAFKYGVTRHYVLGTEAVLPTGEVIRTGGRVVKNVVGYDLTQLLVGSEGTLAILTEITLRLIPKPPARRHAARHVSDDSSRGRRRGAHHPGAGRAGEPRAHRSRFARGGRRACRCRVWRRPGRARCSSSRSTGSPSRWPPKPIASSRPVAPPAPRNSFARRPRRSARTSGASGAKSRRRCSGSRPARSTTTSSCPRDASPSSSILVAALKVRFKMPIPAFGHVGDGNIHVNFMVDGADPDAVRRAQEAEGELFRGVVALDGVISGEHGIGFTKAKYLNLGLSDDTIALMKRVKYAFDPHGILNPGKIFPE